MEDKNATQNYPTEIERFQSFRAAHSALIERVAEIRADETGDPPDDREHIESVIFLAAEYLRTWAGRHLQAHPIDERDDQIELRWWGLDSIVLVALARIAGETYTTEDGMQVPLGWCESLVRTARNVEGIEDGLREAERLAPRDALAAIDAVYGMAPMLVQLRATMTPEECVDLICYDPVAVSRGRLAT